MISGHRCWSGIFDLCIVYKYSGLFGWFGCLFCLFVCFTSEVKQAHIYIIRSVGQKNSFIFISLQLFLYTFNLAKLWTHSLTNYFLLFYAHIVTSLFSAKNRMLQDHHSDFVSCPKTTVLVSYWCCNLIESTKSFCHLR